MKQLLRMLLRPLKLLKWEMPHQQNKVRCQLQKVNKLKLERANQKVGNYNSIFKFLPPASVVEVIESEPSFCVHVCLCATTLMVEPLDL